MARAASFGEPEEIGTPRHPALITGASKSIEEEHRARVRKYTIIMAFRIPALVIAGLAYGALNNPIVPILIIAASIPLPWIAVLVANDRPPRKAEEPSRYPHREQTTKSIEAPHHTIDG